MKFTCDYNELLSGLEKVAIVAEDSNSSDEIKNIIFRFEKRDDDMNVCTLVGVNATTTYRHLLAYDKYTLQLDDAELTDRVCFMQIKARDLLYFLTAYKSVRRTTVDEVTFEPKDNVQINCSVLEYSDDDDKIPFVSNWLFNNIPIKPNMLPSINAQPLNRPIDINKEDLSLYITTMLPILDGKASLYNILNFGSDYAVAFSQGFAALMKNKLAENHIFESMSLSKKNLEFLDKVVCTQDEIKVAKSDTHLYVKTDKSESFIAYNPRITEYETYLKMYNKESGFCVDRLFLKDIIKRLALTDELVEGTVNPSLNTLTLRNTRFTQDLPLLKQQGLENYDYFCFRITPNNLNGAIIGADKSFSSNGYIYFSPQNTSTATMIFTDDTDDWYSVARVKCSYKTVNEQSS